MGWTRRPNPADKDTDPGSNANPLADNLRLNRRQPPDESQGSRIYDQNTVVDNNFASRSQTRRERQNTVRLNTQQIGAWAAEPDNTRKLLMVGGAFVIFLLILALISYLNRNPVTPADGTVDALPSTAAISEPNANVDAPVASADPGFGTVPQPVQTIPGSDPAQQPAAPAAVAFVVTGTGTEGLFLRPEPSTTSAPVTTLPEGTRVEFTGETNNDGTREWRKVRSALGEGWVAADFLQPAQ